MKIALCYESVLPARGGCETYITDLIRRLVADGHETHLYACRWDAAALPAETQYHAIPAIRGPRFLRPWRFGAACLRALPETPDAISIGFDKTWGQDVLYPQGGLHRASANHNLKKQSGRAGRALAWLIKSFDLANVSYRMLEKRQYLTGRPPLIVVNSEMVAGHFQRYLGVRAESLRVIRSAVDSQRFLEHDRLRRRDEWRKAWNIGSDQTAGLFVAMNYRLKGLEPLLHATRRMTSTRPFCLLVAGHPNVGPYERLARRLGIAESIRFLGPRRDVENCYFAADFLVHPTFYDPCSLVVLEALACGLPVITSRFNGASELLHPPAEGFVIDDPHDHEQLAVCMRELVDPARRSACASACRRAAANWTFERHYQGLLQVFAEAQKRKEAA